MEDPHSNIEGKLIVLHEWLEHLEALIMDTHSAIINAHIGAGEELDEARERYDRKMENL